MNLSLSGLKWFRKPHQIIVENHARFYTFDQTGPLTDYDFVVFDTELTGLNKKRDEIISIGAVRIHRMQIVLGETFHCLVKPVNLNHNQATLIHQITPEQLAEAPPLDHVLRDFISFCGNSLLVGHFVELDMYFLNRATRKILGGALANPSVDTMRLARGYKESGGALDYGYHDRSFSYQLDDLSEEFKLPRFKSHDALEDALQSAYLFLYLIKKMQKGGVKTLQQLYRAGRHFRLM
ncbi:MAG: 3'-5' exonuclease [Proteobacteria bacterium]|nr:3'-5' exonuclease [Pseudomonadota bacterium]MBU1687930.1 3'-5' exonuclease [Pseudomonadota bacterium]